MLSDTLAVSVSELSNKITSLKGVGAEPERIGAAYMLAATDGPDMSGMDPMAAMAAQMGAAAMGGPGGPAGGPGGAGGPECKQQ